jgi:hypothetical protein
MRGSFSSQMMLAGFNRAQHHPFGCDYAMGLVRK